MKLFRVGSEVAGKCVLVIADNIVSAKIAATQKVQREWFNFEEWQEIEAKVLCDDLTKEWIGSFEEVF